MTIANAPATSNAPPQCQYITSPHQWISHAAPSIRNRLTAANARAPGSNPNPINFLTATSSIRIFHTLRQSSASLAKSNPETSTSKAPGSKTSLITPYSEHGSGIRATRRVHTESGIEIAGPVFEIKIYLGVADLEKSVLW